MKAYFIFNDSLSKEDKLLPILSAFVVVEAVGGTSDLLEAVDLIRQKHPDAFIFDSSILDGRGDELLSHPLDERGPLVILPRNYRIREACTYARVSIEYTQLCDYHWVMRSIGCLIRQHHGQDTR